ncbi:MAG: XTP/dITP diphosphatase [Candidatus Hodarchaeota archaeon]
MDIVIATLNQNKLEEFKALLEGFKANVLSLSDFPRFPPVVEDGSSFYENALKKATNVARYTGKLTIADDSGLEVDALGGRPGVYSSRFAGENASDEENNAQLLRELHGVPFDKREARFRCVLVVAKPEGETAFVEGECKGIIIDEPRGYYGFGYDPIFLVPEYNKTFSEIKPEEKNRISHRAKALQKLLKLLPHYLSEES